ncbi:MAG TPA: TRAP transporter small permease [Pseudogracilibacillus sp.]|nr:TRAP transporter small permease [Pseudogracilibacillus sp.]
MNKINKVEVYLLKVINIMSVITLSLMCIIVFLNVILRYVFSSGIYWSEEAARYLFMFLIFLGTISALRTKEHLGIDFFIRKLNIKVRKVVMILTNGLLIYIMGILINGSLKLIEVNEGNKSIALNMPFTYIYYMILGFSLATIIVLIMNTIRLFINNSNLNDINSYKGENK